MMVKDYLHEFQKRGNRDALLYKTGSGVQTLSYQKVAELACGTANYFKKAGLNKGDRIILWGKNSPEWVLSFFACALEGIISVPLDIRGTAAFVEKIREMTDPSLIICDPARIHELKENRSITFEELRALAENFPPWIETQTEVQPSDPIAIFFTSGTTTHPKGVVLSHENLCWEIESLHSCVGGFSSDERFLSFLPLSHIFEQVIGLWFPLRRGYSVVYLEQLQPAFVLHALENQKPTVAAVVPRILRMFQSDIIRTVKLKGKSRIFTFALRISGFLAASIRRILFKEIIRQFGRLKYFLVGGATLDRELERFWERIGIPILQGYGLTETTGVVSCNLPAAKRFGSIGKPLPGVEVNLGEDDEIRVRGKNIFTSYFGDTEKSQDTFEGAWFKTGDLGKRDGQGFLYFKGRKKDLIVTSEGFNVYPDDVEAVLRQIKGVRECCVFGDEGVKGEIVHACILPEDPAMDVKGIISLANRVLEPFQRIEALSVWPGEEFPHTPTMKIIKSEVKRQITGAEKPMQVKDHGSTAV